jgi:hypothetical protein
MTSIVYPLGVTVDPDALHFEVEIDGQPRSAKDATELSVSGSKVQAQLNFRGHKVTVLIHAWSDQNGNGQRDSGDLQGSLAAPIVAKDHGLFRGNLTATPDITLTVMP